MDIVWKQQPESSYKSFFGLTVGEVHAVWWKPWSSEYPWSEYFCEPVERWQRIQTLSSCTQWGWKHFKGKIDQNFCNDVLKLEFSCVYYSGE